MIVKNMFKILVRAKSGAKREEVVEVKAETQGLFAKTPVSPALYRRASVMRQFKVAVKEPAVAGKANRAIKRAIAEFLSVAPSRVRIIAGHTSREKVVEVDAEN